MNYKLYNAITDFATKYGRLRFNNDENISAYMELVDKCIKEGKISQCNRKEFSTHGCLSAAITYESDRVTFCK